MAVVMPFRSLRPRKDLVHLVAAPPYDVLNSDEARAMAAENPHSFLHVSKAEIDLPPGTDLYSDAVYAKAKENLDRLTSTGALFRDPAPCYYIYRQVMPVEGGQHSQVGLVAGASTEEYRKDLIKKHELTRKDKEADRTRHVDTLNGQTGPVFLTYRARRTIDALVGKIMQGEPEYDFTAADGIRHTLWVVSDDGTIAAIRDEFAAIDVLYVADGHHRSAAASHVAETRAGQNPDHTGSEEYNYFLAVIFPHDQMQIMAYNRVVKDLKGLEPAAFLEEVRKTFDIEEAGSELTKPQAKHRFHVYLGGKCLCLVPKAGTFDEADPVESLDVSILQRNLLAPILGIDDPRTDKRIDFVGGIRGVGELMRLVDSGKFKVAFALYPTSITDLIAVADQGKIMPPKSTWFEPKLRDAMANHMLD